MNVVLCHSRAVVDRCFDGIRNLSISGQTKLAHTVRMRHVFFRLARAFLSASYCCSAYHTSGKEVFCYCPTAVDMDAQYCRR